MEITLTDLDGVDPAALWKSLLPTLRAMGPGHQAAVRELLWSARVTENGDWVLQPWKDAPGRYRQITIAGRRHYVHRLSYKLFVGPIPDGYQVDHVKDRGCRSTMCFRPDHLEAVPSRENLARSTSRSAHVLRHGRCRRGHRFTGDNVYVNPTTGKRSCRPCKLVSTAASNARARERRRARRAAVRGQQ